jgi:2-dehydropantoate 2-reductase
MKPEIMNARDLSFLVVGAGAVGGITAALLKRKGYNVEIVCKYDDYASLISDHGIEIKGVSGNFTVRMPAFASAGQIKEKKDVVLLASKATDMMDAAKSILPLLKDGGYIVSLQNGFCEDDLASVAGRSRVIGCVVGWGATMEEHGKLSMTSSGEFILGYTDRMPDPFLESLAEILSAVVPTKVTDNISGHLYSKLIINSCITSPGAVCGLYLGKMLSDKKIRNIFIEIMREAMEVADALKIKVEPFGGRLNFYKFLKHKGLLADIKRHIFIRIIGFKYRRLKSSSLQSLERGRPTEIDWLSGYIVRNGQLAGIAVPVNGAIVKMTHEIEKGTRKISSLNFEDPIFDSFI